MQNVSTDFEGPAPAGETDDTRHQLICADARDLSFLADDSSPPYWTLKEYRPHPDQLGHIESYGQFLEEVRKVWQHCYRVLVPGGRLVCIVGDVCLSRREHGRHRVVPLHADITVAWIEPAQSYEKNQLGLNEVFLNSLRLSWTVSLLADAAVLLRARVVLDMPVGIAFFFVPLGNTRLHPP